MPYYELDDCVQALNNILDANKVSLGLSTVLYGDQRVKPKTPAALVAGQNESRELHGTRTFSIVFNVMIYIISDKVSLGMGARQKSVLTIGKSVKNLLHQDMYYSGNLIFGYVRTLEIGTLGRTQGTDMYVGCRLGWRGLQEQQF